MTVACRMMNCPLYDNGFCCGESILISNDGRCFNLIRGFAPDDVKKINEESKMHIEEIEIIEEPLQHDNNAEVDNIDNTGCTEGAGDTDEIQEAC